MRQKIENYLYRIWYGTGQAPWYLRGLSLLFDRLRRTRLNFYARGWFKTGTLDVPVMVVGNITIGGTGKTPLVIFLIDELRKQGLKVGVVSRGYAGSNNAKEIIILDNSSSAAEVGDEPVMIYQHSKVPIVIGRNRVAAGRHLLRHHPELDLLISDDGLQHYQMQRAIELVVVDGQRGFGNTRLLPAGPLREPVSRLHTVDAILSNGQTNNETLIQFAALPFELVPTSFVKLNQHNELRVFQAFYGKSVHAFAGIGNPDRFFRLLKSLGLDVTEHQLSDHAIMPDEFFDQHKGELIVMTEKDAVKYSHIHSDNIWYLPVNVAMQENAKARLMQTIMSKLENAKHDI